MFYDGIPGPVPSSTPLFPFPMNGKTGSSLGSTKCRLFGIPNTHRPRSYCSQLAVLFFSLA
jgi:hypothetical protein